MSPVLHALALAALVVGGIALVATVLVVLDDFTHRHRKEKR